MVECHTETEQAVRISGGAQSQSIIIEIHNFVTNLLCEAQRVDFHCSIHTVLVCRFSDMNGVSAALGG